MFGGVARFTGGMWSFKARNVLATAMHGMCRQRRTGSATDRVDPKTCLGTKRRGTIGWR